MEKQLWELENSKDLLDRFKFLKTINEIIEIKKEIIKNMADDDEQLENEKRFLKTLKDKADKFDVYHQKGVYKCFGCRQYVVDCCCDETGGEDWTKGLEF